MGRTAATTTPATGLGSASGSTARRCGGRLPFTTARATSSGGTVAEHGEATRRAERVDCTDRQGREDSRSTGDCVGSGDPDAAVVRSAEGTTSSINAPPRPTSNPPASATQSMSNRQQQGTDRTDDRADPKYEHPPVRNSLGPIKATISSPTANADDNRRADRRLPQIPGQQGHAGPKPSDSEPQPRNASPPTSRPLPRPTSGSRGRSTLRRGSSGELMQIGSRVAVEPFRPAVLAPAAGGLPPTSASSTTRQYCGSDLEEFRGPQVSLGVGLASADVLDRHQHGRVDARCAQAYLRQPVVRARHHRPRQPQPLDRREHLGSPGSRRDAGEVVVLEFQLARRRDCPGGLVEEREHLVDGGLGRGAVSDGEHVRRGFTPYSADQVVQARSTDSSEVTSVPSMSNNTARSSRSSIDSSIKLVLRA